MRRGYTSYPGDVWRYGRPNIGSNGGAMEGKQCVNNYCYFVKPTRTKMAITM